MPRERASSWRSGGWIARRSFTEARNNQAPRHLAHALGQFLQGLKAILWDTQIVDQSGGSKICGNGKHRSIWTDDIETFHCARIADFPIIQLEAWFAVERGSTDCHQGLGSSLAMLEGGLCGLKTRMDSRGGGALLGA